MENISLLLLSSNTAGLDTERTQKLLVRADDDIQWTKGFRWLRILTVSLVDNIMKLTAT